MDPRRPPPEPTGRADPQYPVRITRSAYPGSMSRGRHAQPEPPRSAIPLLVVALVVAIASVALVWVIDDTWALRAGVTGIVVLALVALWTSTRAASRAAQAAWLESVERRREVADTHRELAEIKAQHLEILLELRTMREEAVHLSQEAARIASDDADQRALMRQMLLPRSPAFDPVYPSLHLPLVRAAFSTDLPAAPSSVPRPASPGLQRESTTGAEAQLPRQILDLTASEIARLRPAN